jgi:hypothetical protein
LGTSVTRNQGGLPENPGLTFETKD